MPDTSSNTEAQPHKNAAVQVQASAETRSQSQDYQRQQQRSGMLGKLIEPEKSSLDTALEQLNDNMKAWATGLRFDVDDDTQKLVVSLVDKESGDVIRAVPSDAALQISKMIAQFKGNSINTKA